MIGEQAVNLAFLVEVAVGGLHVSDAVSMYELAIGLEDALDLRLNAHHLVVNPERIASDRDAPHTRILHGRINIYLLVRSAPPNGIEAHILRQVEEEAGLVAGGAAVVRRLPVFVRADGFGAVEIAGPDVGAVGADHLHVVFLRFADVADLAVGDRDLEEDQARYLTSNYLRVLEMLIDHGVQDTVRVQLDLLLIHAHGESWRDLCLDDILEGQIEVNQTSLHLVLQYYRLAKVFLPNIILVLTIGLLLVLCVIDRECFEDGLQIVIDHHVLKPLLFLREQMCIMGVAMLGTLLLLALGIVPFLYHLEHFLDTVLHLRFFSLLIPQEFRIRPILILLHDLVVDLRGKCAIFFV